MCVGGVGHTFQTLGSSRILGILSHFAYIALLCLLHATLVTPPPGSKCSGVPSAPVGTSAVVEPVCGMPHVDHGYMGLVGAGACVYGVRLW